MIEAHFAVPMAGAVLNTLNTRLDIFGCRHHQIGKLIDDDDNLGEGLIVELFFLIDRLAGVRHLHHHEVAPPQRGVAAPKLEQGEGCLVQYVCSIPVNLRFFLL